MRIYISILFGWLAVVITAGIPMAYGQSVLTVSLGSEGGETSFSLNDLKQMQQRQLLTSNEFVDGERLFQGPLARDVLQASGNDDGTEVTLIAANDYQVLVPLQEFFKYDVILALDMDGVPLSRRDKGPIWVIYPMSDFKELRDPVYNSRLIWQLVKMELN